MRVFTCNHCGHTLFFENVQCLHCGSTLAFMPDLLAVAALEPVEDNSQDADGNHDAAVDANGAPLWRRMDDPQSQTYRMCQNHVLQQACNFAVPASDPNALCVSCRQTRMAPDLSVPANHDHWVHIEAAKRRLYYTLARLGLTEGHAESLIFEFLADLPGQPVMTGHRNGVITLNIAEADDAERARRRIELHEPYRTLLGHLRHESGHYYWDRLILQQGRVESFSEIFGDPSLDYGQALATYYGAGGAAPNWQDNFVSGYATAHPWEDWAETWAHYLHMVDLLETAASYGASVTVPGDGDMLVNVMDPFGPSEAQFDQLVDQWMPVTLMLNSLNRSLGQGDAYPFALSPGALRKLRYVHDVIREAASPAQAPQVPAAEMETAPAGNELPEAPEAENAA